MILALDLSSAGLRPWDVPEFRTGFGAGSVALITLLAVAAVARLAGWRGTLPIGGLGFAAAGLWAIDGSHPLPASVLLGVLGVAVAAGLADISAVPSWATVVLAAPFGWLIAYRGDLVDVGWVRPLVLVAVALGGVLAATADHEWRESSPTLLLLAGSIAGVYATAPDTEESVALLAVVALLMLLGWPVAIVRLGRAGAGASVAVVVWAAAFDGRGRPASIVGGIAGLGLLVALPVGRQLAGRRPHHVGPASPATAVVAVVAAQAVVVLVASRVAGLRSDATVAGAISAATLLAAVVVSAVLVPPGSDDDDRRPRYKLTLR